MPKTYRLYGNLETITKINEINEPNEEKRYLLNILVQEPVTKCWNATFTLPEQSLYISTHKRGAEVNGMRLGCTRVW